MDDKQLRRVTNQARFLKYLLSKNQSGVCEIRIIKDRRWSGYFDDVKSVLEVLQPVSVTPRMTIPYRDFPRDGESNIYFLLNKCDSALLARNYNKIAVATVTTQDLDILCYQFILIDADPERPTGISSTIAEKRHSSCTIRKVYRWLEKRGITGYLADSGNGYHLLIPVEYVNNNDTRAKVKNFLQLISKMFSTNEVSIDTTVDNPSRICKLYGTRACKGSSTADRPHRYSTIHFKQIPDQDVFGILKAELEVKKPDMQTVNDLLLKSSKDQHVKNMRHILTEGKLVFREKEKANRVVFEFENCPVHTDNDGHTYECSVLVEADGQYSGHCFHDSTKTWQDFKVAVRFDDLKLPEKSLIPDDVTDINAFFSDSSAIENFIDSALTPAIGFNPDQITDASSGQSVYCAMRDSFLCNSIPPAPKCLIPAAGLFPRRSVSTLASQEAAGKSTLLTAGLIMPMIFGEPVLGQFKMKKVKTFYIQSDNDQARFMNRIVLPYGYNHNRDKEWVCFFHTLNTNMSKKLANILSLIDQACQDGYEFIIIDNKTSLFPGMVYDTKHANKDSLDFVEHVKKIAVKHNVAIVVVEHCRKRMREQDVICLQDVLGTGTKTIEQCIGLNARYNRYKECKDKPYEYRRRDGEGVIIPLKNAEGIEICQYNIQIDEPHNYLNFTGYNGIYEDTLSRDEFTATTGSKEFAASDESIEAVKKYLYDSKKAEWTYGEVMSETGLVRNTVRKVLFILQGEHLINILPSKGGPGQKTVIVLESGRPREHLLEKTPVLKPLNLESLCK